MRKVILASTSRWRKEILEKSRIPFVVEPSDYEEDMTLKLSPKELAETLATGKAEAVAIKHNDEIVIGADTFIEFEGEVLGKPGTKEKATSLLRRLSGKTHPIHTGYCIIDTKTGERHSGTVTTRVTFRDLPEDEIDAYVATGEAENAGGGYTLQSYAAGFVSHIDGDFYNIVGLPLWKIIEELRHFGVHL
jgi:septum formation protein